MPSARKYTYMSFDEIRTHLRSILKAKGGNLADFSDGSYGRTIIELFAGSADLMAQYAESSFENSFLESAKTTGSVYANARMLGYNPRRPVPAKAGIGIQTTTTGEFDTIRVAIPKGATFGMGDLTLTAMDDMEFLYDRNLDTAGTGLMKLVSGRAVIAEGSFRTQMLISNGQQNQRFIVEDPTFSDYFGDDDPNYADDGNVSHRASAFTTVTSDATLVDNIDIGAVKDDKLYWRISRRGFADPSKENTLDDIELFERGQDNYTTNYTVILNTANDGNVQVSFGDGVKSAIPYGVVTVGYFSTSGERGNRSNVAGTVLSANSGLITITQGDGTESDITVGDLNIALTTDIRGGQDIESIQSVKNNAPAIYSTLDRLVNRLSYKIFLRRYSDVKYATAYGEDILNTKLSDGRINVKYMNQVRFSALKDLYRERDGVYYPTTADEYFLDGYKVNGLMYTWEYDYQDIDITGTAYSAERDRIIQNISSGLKRDFRNGTLLPGCGFDSEETIDSFVASYLSALIPTYPFDYKVFSANLKPIDFVEEGSELHSVMLALNQRGMLSVGDGFHSYVYPSVHSLKMEMDVTLFKGNNFTDIRERIKNEVYAYLKDNTEFSTPVYRSKIASLVHKMVEVAGVDVRFVPVDSGYAGLDIADLDWLGETTYEYIAPGPVAGDTPYYLGFDLLGEQSTSRVEAFVIPDQTRMRSMIREFYRFNVQPHVQDGTISDRIIDKFVAYIWEQVMQQVLTPIYDAMQDARNSGDVIRAGYLYGLMNAMKGWDMGSEELTFKASGNILNMREVDGNALYNYMRYGMEYIKLVRNVLAYRVASNLIDENGNVTRYSNDNEIVQFVIPSEDIGLSVAYDSSLLTDKDA